MTGQRGLTGAYAVVAMIGAALGAVLGYAALGNTMPFDAWLTWGIYLYPAPSSIYWAAFGALVAVGLFWAIRLARR